MLADAAKAFPLVEETFAMASKVLEYDLWALMQQGSQEQLNLTEITQPLLLTSSVALWHVWLDQGGVSPAFMAGHSLGEYSALVCAGVMEFEDAVWLVRNRGRYMQEAVPVGTGAMAAVLGLEDDRVRELCKTLSAEGALVEAVNFNSPGQVVIAGHTAAVEAAGEAFKKAGAKRVMPLPVSAPFHTSLMSSAAERLAADLQTLDFKQPNVPVVHNVNADLESDPAAIRELMIQQTASPVLWTGSIEKIVASQINSFVECGPGKALSGMIKKISRQSTVQAIESPEQLQQAVADSGA